MYIDGMASVSTVLCCVLSSWPSNHFFFCSSFRTSSKPDYWMPHKLDTTLQEYGRTLYRCAVAILRTMEHGYSGYKFPLNQEQIVAASNLFAALEQDSENAS